MKYYEFKKVIEKPYFTAQDLRLHRMALSHVQLTRWKQKGLIQALKRGLYYFTDEPERFSTTEVSFLLYQPSYLSLESALSYYGLIPDIVQSTTAVSTKTTRTFHNAFGHFSYQHIQPRLFFGYTVQPTPSGKYLIAEPEKALLDYFYLHLGQLDGQAAIDELRLNLTELKQTISKQKMRSYLKEFRIKKLEKMINLILRQC